MPHKYRVAVEEIGDEAVTKEPLVFEVTNHDDLLHILKLVQEKRVVPPEEAAELTIGFKLFAEVLLRHRAKPPFADFFPHVKEFMQQLKRYEPR
ncbi:MULTISPECIES: DUF3861 domain-containing protein [Rhizobium]|uniref:DUF3861 domain-containing protein n=1 Tax=Rhizobium indicum TaxID=2583231 RepID=A0ABX6PSE5_9HYPH|nr:MULTISPECIES: DUF3861 domain-containing protein [Rhizobium]MBA1345412.1 DUF3861 domain-containing protein [Rhizobium sp. WYCCWR 11146]NNU67792.1 DUF3861 domain-containing protein [Rhizobium sp. WYCCWR 11152]QKK21525.1 DUF3861 domain-containing protein [Rhizobium indicum]QKK34462.1 DUF3861 domain-containing protein [Rhizobium indicum]